MKKNKNNKLVLYIILVALAIIIVPHLLRYLSGNPVLMGEEAYIHKRIGERIIGLDFTRDDLVVDGRILYYSPYHFLLAIAGLLTSLTFASIIVPMVLGIGSALLFFFLLKNFPMGEAERFAALFVFIVSPVFIYTFSISANHCLSLFLILLTAWSYMKGTKTMQKIAFVSFILAGMINIFNGTILLALLIFLVIKRREDQKHIFFAVLILVLMMFFINPPWTSIYQQTTGSIITETVSDLGAGIGYSVFMLLLAMLGMIWAWTEKKSIYPLYIMTAAIFIAAYFTGAEIMIYAAPIISIFAGIGISKIKDSEWQLRPLKHLMILIMMCGLLFSSISYVERLPELGPTADIVGGLEELKDEIEKGDTILSHYSNGYFIEEITGGKVLFDSNMKSIKAIDKKLIDAHTLFFTRDLEEAKSIFNEYDIKYIVIDRHMKEGLVWDEDGQGLLFLFRNTKTFNNIYSDEEIEIWEIKS